MHSFSKTVNEASITVPGSLTEICSGSCFPQKTRKSHPEISLLLHRDSLEMPYKYIISTI